MSPSTAAPQTHVISYLVLKAEGDPFSGTKQYFARPKSKTVLGEGQLHEGSERPFVPHWTWIWRDKSVAAGSVSALGCGILCVCTNDGMGMFLFIYKSKFLIIGH